MIVIRVRSVGNYNIILFVLVRVLVGNRIYVDGLNKEYLMKR